MRAGPSQRLDRETKLLWRVVGAIWTGLIAVAATIVTLILRQLSDEPDFPDTVGRVLGAPMWAGVLGLGVLFIWLIPSVRWRQWRYEIRENEVDLQHGILYVTRTLVPIARVQHVDTQQGPLERLFGLATVVFYTAAGPNKIPALADHVAAEVRDRIAELTREQDEI